MIHHHGLDIAAAILTPTDSPGPRRIHSISGSTTAETTKRYTTNHRWPKLGPPW